MSDIKLKNVRISYPHIFQAKAFQGSGTPKFSATFLLHKVEHKELIAQIATAMKELAATAFKDKRLPASDKLCLRDGDLSGRAENEGYFIFTASESKRPAVVDKDKTPLVAEDDVIYAGCRVNAAVRLWAQDNQYGKRINANLLGVQFAKDDERLGNGASTPSVDDMFDSEDGEADPFA